MDDERRCKIAIERRELLYCFDQLHFCMPNVKAEHARQRDEKSKKRPNPALAQALGSAPLSFEI